MNKQPLLSDLRVFCNVVRHRSFAAAARDLGVSNALISKRVAILEDVLQARLLHRTTRKLSLTEQGDLVFQQAQRILDEVDQLHEGVANIRINLSGRLRVCSSTGFGRNCLAPAISAFAQQYPALEVQLELLDRPVDLLGEGFQLDIRLGAITDPNLIARRIGRNMRVICAAPAYLERFGIPLALTELEQHRCIEIRERDRDFGLWTLMGPVGRESVRVSGSLSANNGEVAHQWALDGHGIILRSFWDVGPSIERGCLQRILPEYSQEADVWAVYPAPLSSSAKVRVFVQFLSEWLDARGMSKREANSPT